MVAISMKLFPFHSFVGKLVACVLDHGKLSATMILK